jgi:hypothetical protein
LAIAEGGVKMSEYEARYTSGWVEPDEDDKGREQGVNHHKYWNRALDKVVETVPRDDVGPFEVTKRIRVNHNSPGWVDGYRVDLN